MVDLSRYQGTAQFGRAYEIMLENDAHAPGSVDRVLAQRMIRLCPETAFDLYEGYTPTEVHYQKGSRPELERFAEEATADCHSDEERIEALARFCSRLGGKVADDDLDAMRLGGTEEEIILRGSDWCTDVARVACVLCQVAGFAARIVMLLDTNQAYGGHDIIEARRKESWGAVDPLTEVIYRHPDGRPASTWELMNQPGLIDAHSRGPSTLYTTPGQFRAAAVCNYFAWEWKTYDYTVSGVNSYYRSILEMSIRGWPGGLRWLHGEDKP
jgi:hypothetical protein